MITNKMALSLVDVAKDKEHFEHLQTYWNTYHCQSRIYTADGKLYGRYCKNRCCLLCLSIRKADIINRYLPIIQTWEDPHFVTITAKSVPFSRIAKRMRSLIRGFQKITEKYRKRAQREKGVKLIGIKSLESNFNPVKKTYNPHFHLVVANREMAEIIVQEWLAMCPEHLAKPSAQKISRIWDRQKALIEVVKYGSKIFTEPDVNNKLSKNQDRDIYVSALDNILTAMRGIRVFERFGFNLPKTEREPNSRVVSDAYEWAFEPKVFDWINEFTDATLSGYVPPKELVNLLTYNIDTSLE